MIISNAWEADTIAHCDKTMQEFEFLARDITQLPIVWG